MARMQRGPMLRALIVATILIGAVVTALLVWDSEKERVEEERMAAARQGAAAVTRIMDLAASSLSGSQGLLDKTGDLREGQFRRFASDVTRGSVFSSLSWAPVVEAGERRSFARRLGRRITRVEDGRFVRAEEGAVYLPVQFVFPNRGNRRRTVGFNILSDPVRAAAARIARDTGRPKLTAPLQVLASDRTGVNFLGALYQPGSFERFTAERRRRRLRGFISATVFSERLERLVRAQLAPGTELEVTDAGATLVGMGAPPDDAVSLAQQVEGRTWTISVDPGIDPRPATALAVAGGGILLAALIGTLFALAGRRERELEAERRDATVRAEEEALRADVASSLERGVGMDERLGGLADALVPRVADICVVDTNVGDQGWERAAVAARSDDAVRILREIERPRDEASRVVDVEGGEAVVLAPITEELMSQANVDGADLEQIRKLEISSVMVLPLLARGRALGMLALCTTESSGRDPYEDSDLTWGRDIAARAALALDNARLFEREHNTARTLQRRLLPDSLPVPPGLQTAAAYRAGGEGVDVGGDFYDLFRLERHWVAVVGDVCGRGPGAASLTSLLRHTLRTGSKLTDPEHALAVLDRAAREETQGGTFFTLASAWIEDERLAGSLRLRLAVAGHPEPRIIRADGSVERVDPTGPLMGILEDAEVTTSEETLAPGETLLMFTDGITEARCDGELFGDERLDELLGNLAGREVQALVEDVDAAVLEFIGGEPQDDLALLAIRVL